MTKSAEVVHSSSTIQDLEDHDKKSYEGSLSALSRVEEALSALSQASDVEGSQVVLDKFFNSMLSSEGNEERTFETCNSLPDLTGSNHFSEKIIEDCENSAATSKGQEEFSSEQQMPLSEHDEQLDNHSPETDEDFLNMLRESSENFENVLRESNESFQKMLRESVENFRNEVQESVGSFEDEVPQFSEDLQNILSDPHARILQEPNASEEVVTIHVRRKRKASDMDANILSELGQLRSEDPDRLFLLSVVPDLKRIRRDKIDDVKLKILKVIKKNKCVSTLRSSRSSLKSFSSGVLNSNEDGLSSRADGEPLTRDLDELMNSEPPLIDVENLENDVENFYESENGE